MKKLLLLLGMSLGLLGAAPVLAPVHAIHISGQAKDLVVQYPNVYIGTTHGKLQVYDLEKQKFIKEISLPKIKDFMGDDIFAAAASIDYLDGRYLLLSDSGDKGYTDLWIHENNVTKKLISSKDKMTLVKARFIDRDHVLLGFLSNEAALLDINSKKTSYRTQLSESKFSDFALNNDRSKAAFSCESGAISIIDTHSGKVIKTLKGINKDNVYKVDFKKDIVAAAGQDRRAAYYHVSTGRGDFWTGSFLIYATGLSPDADKIAFAMDENNNITVFDIGSKAKLAILKGQ